MYFAIGWPKHLDTSSFGDQHIRQICCDRVKILFAILTDDTLAIWYTKPCVPIVSARRAQQSLLLRGANQLVEWKPDSNALVVATTDGTLLIYRVHIEDATKSIYNQIDPPSQNLKRDSAELFVKEAIPSLSLTMVVEKPLFVPVTCITCVTAAHMMIATRSEKILRIRWDGEEERDFSLDLKRIPFSINQQVSYAVPLVEANTYVSSIDYSPLIGGFAITLNDGRAAYLTAGNLKFDPNQVQGIWAQHIEDATYASINHKYRLIAFGRRNAQASVYTIDDVTGGLELSHTMELSAKDYPGAPGAVRELKWTPDGCAVAVSWANGGISLWSTYGTMLMCSLGWDYGLNVDLSVNNPLDVCSMDWSTEGYQLLMLRQETLSSGRKHSSLVQLDFVKSSLAVNPCMTTNSHLFLQGDDKLYINPGDSLQRVYHNCNVASSLSLLHPEDEAAHVYSVSSSAGGGTSSGHGNVFSQSYNICTDKYVKGDFMPIEAETMSTADGAVESSSEQFEVSSSLQVSSMLAESKHWVVVQLPVAYMATNWPIRFSAIDSSGLYLAAAGRTGVAMYAMATRKWKLFGNERQEKDFLVTGGLLWWDAFLVMGCYSLEQQTDELRLYPRDAKLDNRFGKVILVSAPVMLINVYEDQLVVFTADGFVTIYACVKQTDDGGAAGPGGLGIGVELERIHSYDIRGLCVHPACIVSVTLTTLRNEGSRASQGNVLQTQPRTPETIILNVSGRILMVNREIGSNGAASSGGQLTSTCLASCVECLWVSTSRKLHLRESLWLWCGGHGMRVWLPVFPRGDRSSGHGSHRHTFMSKRIMLSFQLRVYPLAILFEDAIILGAENDTTLYTSDTTSPFSVPFCFLKKTSQVYLHQILRQLIRRNLGYNAWEIAGSCTNLPYFPHSLELLLHEVLEEEATSKEPIPDALLPSVLEFIQEFPVYLQTVVQCARKTEIALWPYLFASAGKPKELFQQCMAHRQLETAASYLIILQNLEPSSVSRQYATILLETALEQKKWDLAKDLVRFLRAIDPNDVDSPRNSFVMGAKLGHSHAGPTAAGALTPNAEDLSLILGATMTRGRSFSTTAPPNKDAMPSSSGASVAAVLPKEHNRNSSNTMSPGALDQAAAVQRRKKSVPNTSKEKQHLASAEEFFIEVILQRHARRLLQEKKLEALGYMSAALDFHLVGWLAKERDRAARVEEFVHTLKQLHEDLEWPKPNLDLKLSSLRRSSEIGSHHESSPSYSLQSLRLDQHQIQGTGGDSGYTSLPTTIPTIGVGAGAAHFTHHDDSATPSERSLQTAGGLLFTPNTNALYNPELSSVALQNMTAKFGDLCRISEEGGEAAAAAAAHSVSGISGRVPFRRTVSDLQHTFLGANSAIGDTEAKLVAAATVGTHQADTSSVVSETDASLLWADDASVAAAGTDQDLDHDPSAFIGVHHSTTAAAALKRSKRAPIPVKLEVKVRYLLQLFTEAGCLDLALLLSVLLLDAASVSRITNSAIRSGSLAVCRQLRNGLKDMTRWSFQECLGYRPFMLQLQPQVNLLDQFVIQQESIPQSAMLLGANASDLDPSNHLQNQHQIQQQQQLQQHLIGYSNNVGASIAASYGAQPDHRHAVGTMSGPSSGSDGSPPTPIQAFPPPSLLTSASARRTNDDARKVMSASLTDAAAFAVTQAAGAEMRQHQLAHRSPTTTSTTTNDADAADLTKDEEPSACAIM